MAHLFFKVFMKPLAYAWLISSL